MHLIITEGFRSHSVSVVNILQSITNTLIDNVNEFFCYSVFPPSNTTLTHDIEPFRSLVLRAWKVSLFKWD